MGAAYVQENGSCSNSSSPHNVTLSPLPSVGNTLVLCEKGASGHTLSSITDPRGNTWTQDVTPAGTTSETAVIWHAYVANAYSAADALTLTATATGSSITATIFELSGIASSSPVDVTGSALVTGSPTSITFALGSATTNAGDLLVATVSLGGTQHTQTWTPPTGWTQVANSINTDTQDSAYYLPGTTGTFSSTYDWTTGEGAAAVVVAYLPASTTTTVDGTAAISLGTVSASATGVRSTFGTASHTLGTVSVATSGVRTTFGTASAVVGTVSISASGTVSGGAVNGTASVTLGGISGSATGIRTTFGTATAPVGVIAVTVTGTVANPNAKQTTARFPKQPATVRLTVWSNGYSAVFNYANGVDPTGTIIALSPTEYQATVSTVPGDIFVNPSPVWQWKWEGWLPRPGASEVYFDCSEISL